MLISLLMYAVNEFWPIVFLNDRGVPGGANDQLWLDTLASEPAFVEATMATAIRFWLPNFACQQRSELHSYRAKSMVMERLSSYDTYSDGFFGAVITMAISEQMVRNFAAWEIHVNGLVQTIEARKARGIKILPPLFTDLFIL